MKKKIFPALFFFIHCFTGNAQLITERKEPNSFSLSEALNYVDANDAALSSE